MNTTEQLKQIQAEVGAWSRRNFPNNQPYHPLLGAIEEVEEYFDAEDKPALEDALADSMIYLCDYCERSGLEMVPGEHKEDAMGKLIHYHLKGEQGIRYTPEQIKALKQEALSGFIGTLSLRASAIDSNLVEITQKTWEKVAKRNWIDNPITAASNELK